MALPSTNGAPALGYRYQLELIDGTGHRLHEERLRRRDFRRAILAAWFDRWRKSFVAGYRPDVDAARIEPRFAEPHGTTPRAIGFRVASQQLGTDEHRMEFGLRYFGSRASRIRAELVRAEQISADGELLYRLHAYLDDPRPGSAGPAAIALDRPTYHIPVANRHRGGAGNAVAWDEPDPDDPPVQIARSVLEEAVEESKRSPTREVGGVLLGHLCRAGETGEVFVQVTSLVSGGQTLESSESSVTFTPETWRLAREWIALRAAGEAIVGWYHSHPFRLCADCRVPAPAECVNKILFYSLDDVQLMETWFEQPFMVGLLAAAESRLESSLGHLPVRLFGWRAGEICPRGFEVLNA
jgi:proteasome lid subunit RPN8/RPN11